MTDSGPRLLMEDETGARHDVSPGQLLAVLRQASSLPRLVVLSSCNTAEHRNGLPSLVAELLQGGIPCVVGWTRPVQDKLASTAVAQLYDRLCQGEGPAQAVARARQSLHKDDAKQLLPTHTWASLQYLTTQPAGSALNLNEPPATEPSPTPEVVYSILAKRMRVLERGFVGRRRELQALERLLQRGSRASPGEQQGPVVGALVVGMKGQGKSCLVGRALQRFSQDAGEPAMVVLHGKLLELALLEAFREEASRMKDDKAEAWLEDGTLPVLQRLELLLRDHWQARSLVVVLDDFEENLDISGQGEALLHDTTLAFKLLEMLVPMCIEHQHKLLITTTARFSLPSHLQKALVEIPLGALDRASIHKLWTRGREGDKELLKVPRPVWTELCERLGNNARILDWARQIMKGMTPPEVNLLLDKAGQELKWQKQGPDKAQQDELAALFLKHMAVEEAQAKVGADALRFIERARVYEVPVPAEALSRLTEGLSVSLEHHLVALANLGLLEMGNDEGQVVYRVSPLVMEKFDAHNAQRWHGVAAEFWWKKAKTDNGWYAYALHQAWEHALQAKRQDIADEIADIFNSWLRNRGEPKMSITRGRKHLEVFPESVAGLKWVGYALYQTGELQEGKDFLEQSIKLAEHQQTDEGQNPSVVKLRLSSCLHELADVLRAQGNLAAARSHLEHSLEIKQQVLGTEIHLDVAASLHELARVVRDQGDLAKALALFERVREIHKLVLGTEFHPNFAALLHESAGVLRTQGNLAAARSLLERSLEIQKQLHGTEFHPAIATSLQGLAGVLHAQGDLAAARSLLERTLEVKRQVHGTEVHPSVTASLHALATVMKAQGDLASARGLLEHSLKVKTQVLGTEVHPSIAASLHELARVLKAQGDLAAARSRLERSLEIKKQVLGTEVHPDVSASLHALAGVLIDQRDLAAARSCLERSLEIDKRVQGTEVHPSIAASLHELARLLLTQGDPAAARSRLERALEIDKQVLGTEVHPSIAASLHELARVLLAQRDLAKARLLFERSLEIHKQVLGTEEHPSVAAALHELARVLLAQRDPAKAHSLFAQCLTIQKQVFGTEFHSDIARSYTSLGTCLALLGRFEESEARFRKAQDILEHVHGTRDHHEYAETVTSLGFLLLQRGRQDEALPLLRHALAVLQVRVPSHPFIADIQGFFSRSRVKP
jgi:tetratricopeptide (TPR) repeat protein